MRAQLAISMTLFLFASQNALAYLSPEHKRIGDTAIREALATAKTLLPLRAPDGTVLVRKDGAIFAGTGAKGIWASFGELIALYGDFRETVKDLLGTDMARLTKLQSFVRTFRIVEHLPTLLKEAPAGAKRFLTNRTHFSSSAVDFYYRQHRRALELVYDAVRTGDMTHLWRALHEEALGGHSLTDLFAAGHDLVDRRETVRNLVEGSARMKRLFKDPQGALEGLFSVGKGLYDSIVVKNIHDELNKRGLDVENLRGTRWRAYGDKAYEKQSHVGRRVSIEAVRVSLESLLDAYRALRSVRGAAALRAAEQGILDDANYYRALRYIPVRYRNAKYRTAILRRKTVLCPRQQYCDMLHIWVVGRLLDEKITARPPPPAPATILDRVKQAAAAVVRKAKSLVPALIQKVKRVANTVKKAARKTIDRAKHEACRARCGLKRLWSRSRSDRCESGCDRRFGKR